MQFSNTKSKVLEQKREKMLKQLEEGHKKELEQAENDLAQKRREAESELAKQATRYPEWYEGAAKLDELCKPVTRPWGECSASSA